MKKTVISIILLIAITTVFAQELPPPAEGKAAVYFIRVSSLGSLVDFAYFDRDKYIGKFYGTKFMRYECDPGEHLLWAKAENRDFVEADLEAGKIYFIEALPQMGAMKAGVSLQPMNLSDPKFRAKVMKVLAKEPVVFTEEQLAAGALKFKDVISKGLEKYQEEKAAGKNMVRITRDAYYVPQ